MRAGDMVLALKGRFGGEYFFVTAVEEGFAYVADGKKRKAANPKKKSIKHLSLTGLRSDAVEERLHGGGNAVDALMRAELGRLRLMLQ